MKTEQLLGPRKHGLYQIAKVLWHLDIFRRSFRELSGHACMGDACIFCALKELFSQLQFSQESALPPDALRRALAETFFNQQRFQLGCMDDAAECFENILLRIHLHIAREEAEDMCNARHCIPHQKFAMTLVEQSVCDACKATSEPLPFTQMVHYVSASALTDQARQMAASSPSHSDLFGQLLRRAGGMGDIRDCPSNCGAKIQICRSLMNRPEIVSVGIVWDSERPNLDQIMSVFATIGTTLRLGDVFHSVVDQRWALNSQHTLVGVVTYYGKHYSTFFFHTKLRLWIYFDDATVREVGPRWEQVVERCRRGRYQPLLLLYAALGGTPVNTQEAPKFITPVTNLTPQNAKRPQWAVPKVAGKCVVHPNYPKYNSTPIYHQMPIQNGYGGYPSNYIRNSPITTYLRLPPAQSPTHLPPLSPGRRAVTPSPEKSVSNNSQSSQIRRAVTPNPDQASKPISDYQNLSDMQAVIMAQNYPTTQHYPVYRSNSMSGNNTQRKTTVQRSNSSESERSSVFTEYEYRKKFGDIPRRRDSGNWSGDRNSASSSSSTSMENPYLYIVGKMQPRSSNQKAIDPGYDSYSLSSTDSLPLQQGLKHSLQLAQIPEVRTVGVDCMQDCESLCREAEELLDRGRILEEQQDLEGALILVQAACTKSRAAMDAPYNNPGNISMARMTHNSSVVGLRSLQRKISGEKDGTLEARHSRENSSSSIRNSGSKPGGNHSRQSSRDSTKGQNSSNRQVTPTNTIIREMLPQPVVGIHDLSENPNAIEIYATLPKRKSPLKFKKEEIKHVVEDAEYLIYDRPGKKDKNVTKEKRARSEERSNKKEVKEEKDKNKKQHKIRRKLLMGGLIKRKNRSMPDLREEEVVKVENLKTQDDSVIKMQEKHMSGYLSEGHLEFAGNPNLEKSRLMRKTSGKMLHPVNKVPPPPPLRKSSQLTKSQMSFRDDPVQYANIQGMVTRAEVHPQPDDEELPPYPVQTACHSRQPSEEFPPPPDDILMGEDVVDSVKKLTHKYDLIRLNDEQNRRKKKNVTFCDQVVLVATADDDEDDGFIPNPILERVLRCANIDAKPQPESNRMNIPLCAPERQKPQPPQYTPPPQPKINPIVAVQQQQQSVYYHPIPNRNLRVFPPYQQPPQPKPVEPNVTSCHLCRKKQVILPAMYCPDCDFYMSRFRTKT